MHRALTRKGCCAGAVIHTSRSLLGLVLQVWIFHLEGLCELLKLTSRPTLSSFQFCLKRHLNLSDRKIPNYGRDNLAGWPFCQSSSEPVLSAWEQWSSEVCMWAWGRAFQPALEHLLNQLQGWPSPVPQVLLYYKKYWLRTGAQCVASVLLAWIQQNYPQVFLRWPQSWLISVAFEDLFSLLGLHKEKLSLENTSYLLTWGFKFLSSFPFAFLSFLCLQKYT